MSDLIDTGFDAVFAGEVYNPDAAEEPTPPPDSEKYGDQLVTATVTTALTDEGKEAAKALVALPPLDWPSLSKLAREVAMDIKERHAILKDYNLTQTQYDYLEANNEFYQQALRAACQEWHAPLSTQERLRVEAAAILEDGLPGLGARMQAKSEGLPGVIEAAKLFAKIAGVGEREAGTGAPGERFTINIDLGGGQKIVAQSSPVQSDAAQPSAQRQISADREGSS